MLQNIRDKKDSEWTSEIIDEKKESIYTLASANVTTKSSGFSLLMLFSSISAV
jgi:hypothetical protein